MFELIQDQYLNRNRTELSNTFFSLSYPGWDISRLPLAQAADVINLHWVADFQSPPTLKRLFEVGKPVVWTLHDQWAFTGGCHYSAGCEGYRSSCTGCPQLREDPYDLPAAILGDKLDAFRNAKLTIVTPSHWMAECARSSRAFRDVPVRVIPNGLETDIFQPASKARAKTELGFSRGQEDGSVRRGVRQRKTQGLS